MPASMGLMKRQTNETTDSGMVTGEWCYPGIPKTLGRTLLNVVSTEQSQPSRHQRERESSRDRPRIPFGPR